MELNCFSELSQLEKVVLLAALVIGTILFVLGIILAFQKTWRGEIRLKWKEREISIKGAPIIFMVLGVALVVLAGLYMRHSFPADGIQFAQKAWTLQEVKERLERFSRTQLVLNGQAASFKLDKPFSGACAQDIVTSICDYYAAQLQCSKPTSGVFVITTKGP